MWHICHHRADSLVWLSHMSSILPWSGAPKVRLYDTFLGSLHHTQRIVTNCLTTANKKGREQVTTVQQPFKRA